MSIEAIISFRAALSILDKATHIVVIKVTISLPILHIMIVSAVFEVVLSSNVARAHFECIYV